MKSEVFVVIPAFNEARLIERTLASIPPWVDQIFVVDDASTDETSARAGAVKDARIVVIRQERRLGVGAAIVRGYRESLRVSKNSRDVFAVMAGDNQMDPEELSDIVSPIASGIADYVKGNRFLHPEVSQRMPKVRYWGGRVLSGLTARATGLPIHDSQCGYTAIAQETCGSLPLGDLWKGFGYPNDLLSQLALLDARVFEVMVTPRYADEQSKLRVFHLPWMLGIIGRAWLRRIANRAT